MRWRQRLLDLIAQPERRLLADDGRAARPVRRVHQSRRRVSRAWRARSVCCSPWPRCRCCRSTTPGLALIGLGVAMLVAEAFLPSFGVIGVGGLVAFVLGSLFLFDTPDSTMRVDRSLIAAAALTLGVVHLRRRLADRAHAAAALERRRRGDDGRDRRGAASDRAGASRQGVRARRVLGRRHRRAARGGRRGRGDRRARPATARAAARADAEEETIMFPLTTALGIAVVLVLSGLRVLKEFERGVVFRLGRLVGARGPGIIYLIPLIERMERVDLRTVTMDVPPQDVITQGQRLGEGQRGAVLPRRRPAPRHRRGGQLSVRHLAARADHAAQRLRAARARRAALGTRRASTSTSRRSSTRRPIPGASRSSPSRSSTSTCRRRCSARWPRRRRPSASAAPR